MKKFLKVIQSALLEQIAKAKTPSLGGQISGAILSELDKRKMNYSDFEKISKRINGYSGDQKRFKEDRSKIVIEKSFLLNALNLESGFFLFRPINNKGETFVALSSNFDFNRPKLLKIHWGVYLAISILIAVSGFLLNKLIFIGFILLPALRMIAKKIYLSGRNNIEKWDNYYRNPYKLLTSPAYSLHGDPQYNRTNCVVKINMLSCPFKEEYGMILSDLVTLINTKKVSGKIVWLWRFDFTSTRNDDVIYTSYKKSSCSKLFGDLRIDIDVSSSNLMPGIETENSFIFCIDNFTQEMEEEHELSPELVNDYKDELSDLKDYPEQLFKNWPLG